AHHWQGEFDTLCELLAHAAVVSMDETGWKVGNEGCSLWTFVAAGQRVFLFGCHKDTATLDSLLPPEVFHGIGVSDDAAVYRQRFDQAQKCWTHLLRKAIRLALLYPHKQKYARFLDGLLELYRDAKRVAADGRLGKPGRKQRIAELEGRLCTLCRPHWHEPSPEWKPHERDFANLVNELMQRPFDEELFTFVLHPEVAPTNNATERLQRNAALERKAGRTSKTAAGAYRRSILVSVLESLRANLEPFTLASVLAEVQRWLAEGLSLFQRQWHELRGGVGSARAGEGERPAADDAHGPARTWAGPVPDIAGPATDAASLRWLTSRPFLAPRSTMRAGRPHQTTMGAYGAGADVDASGVRVLHGQRCELGGLLLTKG